jgi:hypothetical protein
VRAHLIAVFAPTFSDHLQARDPALVDTVCHVVGLYPNPPERAPVLGVGEALQIQTVVGTMPFLLMRLE